MREVLPHVVAGTESQADQRLAQRRGAGAPESRTDDLERRRGDPRNHGRVGHELASSQLQCCSREPRVMHDERLLLGCSPVHQLTQMGRKLSAVVLRYHRPSRDVPRECLT